MKTYLKDLKFEEIIKRLKNGEVVHGDGSWIYKMIDGIICAFWCKESYIGAMIDLDAESESYFETEEPFEIKETGLYKTRDGKRAFVSYINEDVKYCIIGIVEGENAFLTWTVDGSYHIGEENPEDIVSKWEED